jgi:hypothetical protein
LTNEYQKCLPCNLLKSLKKKKYVKTCEDRPSWHGICLAESSMIPITSDALDTYSLRPILYLQLGDIIYASS